MKWEIYVTKVVVKSLSIHLWGWCMNIAHDHDRGFTNLDYSLELSEWKFEGVNDQ